MVIGYDGSRAFLRDKTGTEIYSYQLLLHIAKVDKKNRYIVYLRPGVAISPTDWPSNFQFKNLNFYRLWTQIGLGLQTFEDKLDVLFVPSHTVPLIRKPGLKTVMTVHDLGAEYLPKMHQLKQQLYLGLISRVQIKSCTKLIAVSNATKNDLVNRLNIAQKKIQVIYEGYEENLKTDVQVDILKQNDIEKNKYLLFVGTIQPRKNLERLIKAFFVLTTKHKEFSEYKLVLAGSRGWLSDDLFKLPSKLGREDSIVFLGRVKSIDLATLYKNALGFVFPSLFEGFGLPILEAFAFNLPVLTSDVSSMPEIAGKGAILVNPYKTDEIYQGMLELVKNQSLRIKLIKEGQSRLARFSWDKSAKETKELLEEVGNG